MMFSENTFDNFVSRLKEHEMKTNTKYVIVKAPKSFSVEQVSPTSKQVMHWLDGTPYFLFGTKCYHCHQGRDSNLSTKRKYAEEREKKAAMEHSHIKRYHTNSLTKKIGCPATVSVSRVIRMPEYKFSGTGSIRYHKKKFGDIIRKRIRNGERFGEEVYIFNLPEISEHSNHLVGESAAVPEPVDSRVQEYVNQLVVGGEKNITVISRLLKTYVKNELQEHDRLRKRFFPKIPMIRKMISSAKSKFKSEKTPIHQKNTDIMKEENTDIVIEENTDIVMEANTDIVKEANTDIVMDANTDIVMEANTDIVMEANNDIVKEANTDIVMDANTDIVMDANTDIVMDANTDIVMEANNDVIRGSIGSIMGENRAIIMDENTDIIRENTHIILGENTDVIIDSSSLIEAYPEYEDFCLKGSARRQLIKECNDHLKSLKPLLRYLGDSDLVTVNNTLKDLRRTAFSKVLMANNIALLVESEVELISSET